MAHIPPTTAAVPASITSLIVPAVSAPVKPAEAAAPAQALSELHFLVHPLFVGDPCHKRDEEWIARGIREARGMAGRYAAQAGRLAKGALMCAFLHVVSYDFDERHDPFAKEIKGFIRHLHELLGPRVMFFGAEVNPFAGFRVVGVIMGEMRRRGLMLGRNTATFAYGEVLQECVKEAAQNLREGFDVPTRMRIPISLTDAVYWWEGMDRRAICRLRREFREDGLMIVEDIPRERAQASKHMP